jgi:hypothetical protein
MVLWIPGLDWFFNLMSFVSLYISLSRDFSDDTSGRAEDIPL